MSVDNLALTYEKEFCLFFVPLASPKPSAKLHNHSNFIGEAIVRIKIHRRGKEKKKSQSSFLDKWLYVKKQEFSKEKHCSVAFSGRFLALPSGLQTSRISFPPSLSPPTLDDSIWQELLIERKNPDCLCATPANLSGEMMFFAQQFLFSTECQHEENSWSDFLFSIQAWWPRNKSSQRRNRA